MKPRVIAIALDSVPEPVLRRLLGEEELPSIGALLATGEMSNVGPSSAIGSMSVWPSFASGLPADEHRFVHDWLWDPDAMRVRRARWNADEPFWEALAAEGCRSVVLDVPFVRQRAKRDLFTIEGWGCHEGPGGPTRAQPASLRGLLRRAGRHPYYAIRQDPGTATGHVESSRRLSQLSIEGIRTRARLGEMLVRDLEPDLLLLNFPEIHLGTHQLLHLVSPEHPCSQNGELRDLYLDLFREMDRAVGRIVDAAPTGTSVILFSLLGMRPARGNPLLHAPLLESWGYSRPAASARTSRIWDLRHRVPPVLRNAYYELAPRHLRYWLGKYPFPDQFDWSATRAFPLYSNFHGFIRINLAGRERMGIVPPSAYQPLREEIADRFLQCVTDDGHPIAERVVLASAPPSMEWPDTGPDLTIHWSEHALMNRPLRTLSPPVEGDAAGGDLTAVHEDRGFVIARGARSASHENEPLMPEDLGAEVCRVLDRTEEHAAVVQRNRASHLSRSLESRFFRSDFRPDRLERQG